jgi:hypothetical protein
MNIKNVFAEIEYYESIGKYDLADKLTKQLSKIARRFNPSDIAGGQGFLRSKLIEQIDLFIKSNPDCAACFASGEENEPVIIADFKDTMAAAGDNWEQIKAQYDSWQSKWMQQDLMGNARLSDPCKRCFSAISGYNPPAFQSPTSMMNSNELLNSSSVPPIPAA